MKTLIYVTLLCLWANTAWCQDKEVAILSDSLWRSKDRGQAATKQSAPQQDTWGFWDVRRAWRLATAVRPGEIYRILHDLDAQAAAGKATAPAVAQSAADLLKALGNVNDGVIADAMDQPWKFPGGDSGVTLGHGYDLGAETKEELLEDWKPWLSGSQLERLCRAIGKSGPAAEALCGDFRDIKVTTAAADDVFYRRTVPKYFELTRNAFPNVEKLPGAAQGALLSLVFNRGTAMKGDRRAEMRNIQELLEGDPPYDLKAIAKEFRAMKRLWEGRGLNGLVVRREREARWVEGAA